VGTKRKGDSKGLAHQKNRPGREGHHDVRGNVLTKDKAEAIALCQARAMKRKSHKAVARSDVGKKRAVNFNGTK